MKKIIKEKSKILLLEAEVAVCNTLRETVDSFTDKLQKSVIDSLHDIKTILDQKPLPNKNFYGERGGNLGHLKNKQDETKHISTYECLKCSKTFSYIQSLRKHEKRVHLEIKHLKCHSCDYATDDKERLNLHIENHHPEHARYNCSICEFSVCKKIDLKKHYQNVHNIKDCRIVRHIKTNKAKYVENDISVLVTADDSISTNNETNPYKQAFEYVNVNYV